MKYSKQKFSKQSVLLDGNEFKDCQFDRCEIQYAGIMPIQVDSCSFADCQYAFIGPAQNTLGFMAALYTQGGDARLLLESTFDNIRGVEGDSEPEPSATAKKTKASKASASAATAKRKVAKASRG